MRKPIMAFRVTAALVLGLALMTGLFGTRTIDQAHAGNDVSAEICLTLFDLGLIDASGAVIDQTTFQADLEAAALENSLLLGTNVGAITSGGCVGQVGAPSVAPSVDPSAAASEGPTDEGESVTICHATGSESNPYVLITLNAAGVVNGHLGEDHQNGEDIIPVFEFRGETYGPQGDQSILANGCVVAAASVPASSAPSVEPNESVAASERPAASTDGTSTGGTSTGGTTSIGNVTSLASAGTGTSDTGTSMTWALVALMAVAGAVAAGLGLRQRSL